MEQIDLRLGDCRYIMAELEDNSIEAVVCDPPYELGFLNRKWDSSGIAYDPEVWAQCYRALKPGGYLLAFGGARTYHRLACAIEDTGFIIHPVLGWLHGQGFPKAMNLSKMIDKAGLDKAVSERWAGWVYGRQALKPCLEPICMAAKPPDLGMVENVQEWGTGAINVGACRVKHANDVDLAHHEAMVRRIKERGGKWTNSWANNSDLSGASDVSPMGRFPPNVLLSHAPNCDGSCAEGCAVKALNEQAGVRKTGEMKAGDYPPREVIAYRFGGRLLRDRPASIGPASRFYPTFTYSEKDMPFFYCPKASKGERENGLEDFPMGQGFDKNTSQIMQRHDPDTGKVAYYEYHPSQRHCIHPTVKPIALMRWLVRLVTPPNGRVLDPFMGSGTTGIAATLEGFAFTGIEKEQEYFDIAKARIEHWATKGTNFPLPL